MKKWWSERSAQEKWMVALIVVLLIGIAVRWTWVSSEVAGAWRDRFTAPAEQVAPTEQTAPAASADSLP
jgi:cytoskeletal protein RodZ